MVCERLHLRRKDLLLPVAVLPSAHIHYRIFGDTGPWIVVMSGGRKPIDVVLQFAKTFAQQGFRVVLYERRNCGRSSMNFKDLRKEEDIWVEDLCHLLDHLDIEQVYLMGKSRTWRVALGFALAYPARTLALGFWGVGGGAKAVRHLNRTYYGKYIAACADGGMAEVIKLDQFKQMIALRPKRAARLLALNPVVFTRAMVQWQRHFQATAHNVVMGAEDDDLRAITCPTMIVPLYDGLHPTEIAVQVHEMIADSDFCDFRADPDKVWPDARVEEIAAKLFIGFFKSCSHG